MDLKGEGNGKGPAIVLIGFLGPQGKPGRPEGFLVSIDRAHPGFFPLRDLCYGQPGGAGLDCPDGSPLPG